jgi:membrane fusion protein (multidrug efflux system)
MSDNQPKPGEPAAATAAPASATAPATAAPRRPYRGVLRWALLIAGPVIVGAVAWHYYELSRLRAVTDNAYVQADSVAVSAAVGGPILRVRVAENQLVHAGDILFEIDDASFRIARDQAAAQLATVRSFVEGLESSYAQVLEEMALAETDIDYAEGELARQQGLADRSLGTKSDFDKAQHELDAARLQIPILRQRLAQLESQLGGSPHPTVESHSAYRMVQAMLEKAELELERTQVRAPIDGIVSQVPLPGDYAAPGTPVLALVANGNLWVEANFKETELTHVKVGQPAIVRIDTYPDVELRGQVESISPATGAEFSVIPAQNASGNWVKVAQRIPVRIRLENPGSDIALRAGMSATVTVDISAEMRGDASPAFSAAPGARDDLASRSAAAAQ